jgi:hypothetical protein
VRVLCARAAIAAMSGVAYAEGTLRIVPLVRAEQVIVSIDLDNGYTDEVRQVINGGVRTTFTYDVDLKMIVPAWVDRTIGDGRHHDHRPLRHADSRAQSHAQRRRSRRRSTGDGERSHREEISDLVERPAAVPYDAARSAPRIYVRISAHVRPPGATLLGWATGVTNLAKFTFVP